MQLRSRSRARLLILAFGPWLLACTVSSSGVLSLGEASGRDGSLLSEGGAAVDAAAGGEAGAVADSRPGTRADAYPIGNCATTGCPAGYSCSSSGVCKSASGVPRFSHVFIIFMENHDYSEIIGNSAAPYLNSLATTYGLAGNYFQTGSPSLPNYLALTAGTDFGVCSDCLPAGSSCACPQSGGNIAKQLEAAGLTWHEYAEDMGTPCNYADGCDYASHHNPFTYYTDLGMSDCIANDVDFSSFAGALAKGGQTYMAITPNMCNDMHNCGVDVGDTWIKNQVPAILASSAWKNDGVLFIVWDEGDTGQQVAAIVVSPLGKPGYRSTTRYDHYSLLATIQDGLGVPRLANTVGATPMADFFR